MNMTTFASGEDLLEMRLAETLGDTAHWFAVPSTGSCLIQGAAASFVTGLNNAKTVADRVCFFDEFTSAYDMQDGAFALPCEIGVHEFNLDLATLCDAISDDALWKRLVHAFMKSDLGLRFALECGEQ
jgi:hypothetical protein